MTISRIMVACSFLTDLGGRSYVILQIRKGMLKALLE